MRKTVAVLAMLGRLLGVIQILVGLAIWFGFAAGAVAFHMAVGSLFVLVLWIVGLIALFVLDKRGLALFTLLWGGLVLWFGMAQTTLLVGTGHWAIRLAHLLVGMAAIGLVESLGKATKAHYAAKETASMTAA
ncbi:MAG TPA: hypothetical protein VN600_00105 [Gemmatimonadaceae bacterium]|nr:hypothetical protein [Gemmatimonadaceae bacterium]